MKTKYFISFVIVSLALISSVILINKIFAQGTTGAQNIQYPVKELENCKDESACKFYCDKSENTKSCVNFAEKNNLMSKEEIEMAKKFMAAGSKGPGGCKGRDECETYCNNMDHIDGCISFAEENNLIPPEELEEAKKVQAAIKRGVKPPSCGNKKQCDIYCDQPEHMEECIAFGIEAGFIQGQELENVQKMLAAVKKGVKPPPCKGKEACDIYCGNPDNMEMCMTFAMEAGFMSEKDKADSQKMLGALKKGIKPPNCRGKDECDTYCQQEQHFDECTKFAEAAGFMTPEEATMARKTGGKGPAGCKSKDECDAFCNNPDNQETCLNFAKENGMIPEADLKRMEEGKQQFKRAMQDIPPEVSSCLDSSVGAETMAKFKNGEAMPPKEIGDKMQECFEKNMPQRPAGAPGAGGSMPPAGQTGPGGCKTDDECKSYCESHPDECKKFQPGPGTVNPGGQIMPQQAGPGGCKGPEECKVYCESHPDECKNSGNSGQQFAPGTEPGQMMPPCEGENCPPPPSGSGGGPGPAVMPPCESGNCPPPPSGNQQYQQPQQPMQPGTQVPPEGFVQPPEGFVQPPGSPPAGGTPPPTGGNLQPGEYVPPPPPSGETTPPPPPPTEQPTSFLDSFLGLILYPFKLLLR